MKIIFLDFDGVMALMHKDRDEFGSLFHTEFINNLKKIVDNTGAKIVVSSTWRSSGLSEMKKMWLSRKMPSEIIDITPRCDGYTSYSDRDFETKYLTVCRGHEIQWWLSNVGKFQRINWSKEKQMEYMQKSNVENYVIMDDDSDMLYCQREHFVRCSNRYNEPDAIEGYGLTKKAAIEAIKILNSNLISLYYK